ncbi:hypothetical protein MNV49_007002 [Pseudohyphozyma bogoriensis]|nr:hypothetical protein MNV49_007002 [Pseudohyphozyma bogoriensis]
MTVGCGGKRSSGTTKIGGTKQTVDDKPWTEAEDQNLLAWKSGGMSPNSHQCSHPPGGHDNVKLEDLKDEEFRLLTQVYDRGFAVGIPAKSGLESTHSQNTSTPTNPKHPAAKLKKPSFKTSAIDELREEEFRLRTRIYEDGFTGKGGSKKKAAVLDRIKENQRLQLQELRKMQAS